MSHIPTLSSQASAARVLRVVRWVRWILPLGLVAVAAAFEWSEHVANEPEPLSTGFAGEIIIFALIGPIAVAITLWWLGWLLAAYVATSQQLAAANRGLEAAVADRTRHLRSATDQLAEANTELAAANDELRKLDQMKSEFVALVSHQLRAPLTNIIGALELVAQDADRLPASSQRTLQILTKESHRLSRLIRTILEVSRLEAGRLAPRLGAVAIDPLLSRTAASTLDPDRPWTLAVPHGLPPVWADEVLLEEVVRNLLENAALYSPRGASVDVTAAVRDGSVEIAVVDHGPGIPVDERELVFSSFHRIGGDDATADGYGLGLYFAHKLLVAQGGTIRVESPAWPDEDAPGSRFVVTLPLAGLGPDEGDPEGSAL
ncbi:MAG: sensor histidine kinase [Candidatus Limnocylindrales bacterium]